MNKEQFVSELAKLRPSATFLSLSGYRNEHSEVADYSIVFHMSYENALKRSIVALEGMVPADDLQAVAKRELIDGYTKSLSKMAETSIEEVDDAYTRFFDDNNCLIKGIKLHTSTDTLHMYGLVVNKKVLIPGNYSKKNSKPLTIAKNKLRNFTPCGKFRQFKITNLQVDFIKVENILLLPPL